jgi:hypothetical protein
MESPTLTVSDLSSISNHKEILRNLKTLILNTVYETCPEIDKRWTLDLNDWNLDFNKDNTISFVVCRIFPSGCTDSVVRAKSFPFECFCNSKILADALYKDREKKREAERIAERAKEKEIRYKKFLELKKELKKFIYWINTNNCKKFMRRRSISNGTESRYNHSKI